jgi:hypothetical protein
MTTLSKILKQTAIANEIIAKKCPNKKEKLFLKQTQHVKKMF